MSNKIKAALIIAVSSIIVAIISTNTNTNTKQINYGDKSQNNNSEKDIITIFH